MLAASLGDEMATKLVDEACADLRITDSQLTEEDARRILELLALRSGLVGITARVSLSRMRRSSSGSLQEIASQRTPGSGSKRRPISFVASLLGSAIGEERATAMIKEIARAFGFSDDELTLQEAIAVLEKLAERPGVVGVTARFAKTRLHLQF